MTHADCGVHMGILKQNGGQGDSQSSSGSFALADIPTPARMPALTDQPTHESTLGPPTHEPAVSQPTNMPADDGEDHSDPTSVVADAIVKHSAPPGGGKNGRKKTTDEVLGTIMSNFTAEKAKRALAKAGAVTKHAGATTDVMKRPAASGKTIDDVQSTAVMKRPAAAGKNCTHTWGALRVTKATDQSYACFKDEATGKFHLLVAVSKSMSKKHGADLDKVLKFAKNAPNKESV
eukprot:8877352-Karenia_brevis.AAC.1